MQRYFLHLAYNGRHFHGWQAQNNTDRTIQYIMQKKLGLLLHEDFVIHGCGRTDTGVHASQFYAHFDSEKEDLHQPENNWLFKMNQCLPNEIAVYDILPVVANANARFSAISRMYKFHINQKPNPFTKDFSWYLYGNLDMDKMNEAASIIKHNKDFSSFAKANNSHKTYICHIQESVWEKQEDSLVYTVKANRFLRNMVRALVGTMVDVGKGKITVDDFKNIIEAKNRSSAGVSAHAYGLHLVEVEYPKHIFIE